MTFDIDVSVDPAVADGRHSTLVAKLSSELFEVNVWFTAAEAQEFVRRWQDGSLSGQSLGQTAGLPAVWSTDQEGHLYLLLGGDTETWDIGFTFSTVSVNNLANEFLRCAGRGSS